MSEEETSIIDKLDAAVPAPLAQFDAFPKLLSTYKTRSESRGFITLFVGLIAFMLMLNDIGEFIWGWPDHEFSVDSDKSSFMNINVDLLVNMPCKFLSVDLRDAIGDRLYLNTGLRRDGTVFDVGQATKLKEHSAALSARQVVAQSRRSRGFFSNIFRRNTSGFRPTYNYQADGSACRVWGSLEVKKVTANLHITTLGHGYASHEHVDHSLMNLSHTITEFSFGPYFPDITQPLDYSYETTNDPFVAYQYFLHVVPTTYIAPRSRPLHTHQYSVTHYTRILEHNRGTPGIFFKFELEPLSLTIHQRTTSFTQLVIRCVGVIGGVFVCMGYAIRITTRAVEVVSGADHSQGIVAAEASGAKVGLRSKWGGSELRARPLNARMVPQGTGWILDSSPYGSYANTPVAGTFSPSNVQAPYMSPTALSGMRPPSVPGTPNPTGTGLGLSPGSFGPSLTSSAGMRSPGLGPPRSPRASMIGLGSSQNASVSSNPGTPAFANFPPTLNPADGNGREIPLGRLKEDD